MSQWRRQSDERIVRSEWAASITAGLATTVAGAYAVHRMGGRPVLCAGFLLMPSFYASLATRESLVLSRHTRPQLYEAGLAAGTALLPLVILPPRGIYAPYTSDALLRLVVDISNTSAVTSLTP